MRIPKYSMFISFTGLYTRVAFTYPNIAAVTCTAAKEQMKAQKK